MTPDQYTASFKKTINELTNQYNGELMVKVGITALSLLRGRVQEKGENAEGQKYRPYSTKDMLIGKKSARTKQVQDLLFGDKKKRAAMDWVTLGGNRYSQFLSESAGISSSLVRLAILKGGYKKLRALWGMQTDHVDFMVTGRMWNNINIISTQSDHQNGIAKIGAKNDEEKKKLEGNTKRRGDILDLSQAEQDELIKRYNLNALQIFKNNGL